MFKIMGKYTDCPWEEIDSFGTRKEAEVMLAEYKIAYGAGWSLKIVKGR